MAPNRVRRIRREREIYQIALAREVGISRQHLHDIERGRRMPTLPVAQRIARALDLTLDDLFPFEPTDASETTRGV